MSRACRQGLQVIANLAVFKEMIIAVKSTVKANEITPQRDPHLPVQMNTYLSVVKFAYLRMYCKQFILTVFNLIILFPPSNSIPLCVSS